MAIVLAVSKHRVDIVVENVCSTAVYATRETTGSSCSPYRFNIASVTPEYSLGR